MRDYAQIASTPREWLDLQARERERCYQQFMAMCRAARRNGEPWVEWIDNGCPPLTPEQYAASDPQRGSGRRRAPAGAIQ